MHGLKIVAECYKPSSKLVHMIAYFEFATDIFEYNTVKCSGKNKYGGS